MHYNNLKKKYEVRVLRNNNSGLFFGFNKTLIQSQNEDYLYKSIKKIFNEKE